MSGSPSAVRGALDSVRNGGTVALLGLPAEPVSIDLPDQVIFKGLTIHGINGRRMFDTWYRAEELLVSGSVKIDRVISHELPFERLDEAFELLREGTALKVLLNVSQAS
jgi:threonine 3-dehydrogenase